MFARAFSRRSRRRRAAKGAEREALGKEEGAREERGRRWGQRRKDRHVVKLRAKEAEREARGKGECAREERRHRGVQRRKDRHVYKLQAQRSDGSASRRRRGRWEQRRNDQQVGKLRARGRKGRARWRRGCGRQRIPARARQRLRSEAGSRAGSRVEERRDATATRPLREERRQGARVPAVARSRGPSEVSTSTGSLFGEAEQDGTAQPSRCERPGGARWREAAAAARAAGGEGDELMAYSPGSVPRLASSYRPALVAAMPQCGHTGQVARAARQRVAWELQSGDRAAPSGAAVLELAATAVAMSHDPEALFMADTQFRGPWEGTWRARLAEPVLGSRFAIAMEENWQRMHLEQCARCRGAARDEAVAGFHPECWGLRAYVATTRGWMIPIEEEPPQLQLENYPSVRRYPGSAAAAFRKIALGGAFAAAASAVGAAPPGLAREFLMKPPRFVNPSTGVVRPADAREARAEGRDPKMRLATDMARSTVNARFAAGRFGYSAVQRLMTILSPGCWMFSVDISSFYTRLWVAMQSRKWLAIEVPWLTREMRQLLGAPDEAFVDEGLKRAKLWVQFRSMPFGLKCACLWASQVSAMICQYAARRGIAVVSYIDDIAGAVTREEGRAEGNRKLARLEAIVEQEFGLPVARAKTVEATQRMEFLGMLFDSLAGTISISTERSEALVDEIGAILRERSSSRSALASCVGRLSWLAQVMIGARGRVAPLYRELRAARGPRMADRVVLSRSARADLAYFDRQLRSRGWTGARWIRPLETVESVRSDASDSAMFAIHQGRFFLKRFSQRERATSSHSRELIPAAVLSALVGHEWGSKVVAFTFDNSGSAFSASSLSSSDRGAQVSLRALGDNASTFNFQPVGLWQPRTALVALDAGSKVVSALESRRPVYVPFAAGELAVASVRVGRGMWLFPVAKDVATGTVVGYVAGEEGASY